MTRHSYTASLYLDEEPDTLDAVELSAASPWRAAEAALLQFLGRHEGLIDRRTQLQVVIRGPRRARLAELSIRSAADFGREPRSGTLSRRD